MYIRLCFMIIIIHTLQISDGKRSKRENVNREEFRSIHHQNNCSRMAIDVRLQNTSEAKLESNQELRKIHSSGIIEIIVPHKEETTFLCFPTDYEEYRQTYLFSHIACRQLGFMTFVSMNEKNYPERLDSGSTLGLRASNFNCTGKENKVSQCKWNEIRTTNCRFVTEISCGGCHDTLKGFSGVVKSPGSPFAYLFDTSCEWNIMVPRRQTILLTISPFGGEKAPGTTDACPLHKPYIEILYGVQTAVTILKLCNLKEVHNLSIPFNTVKIKIFTGFYTKSGYIDSNTEQGIAISYEAIGVDREYVVPLKLIALTFFGIFFIGLLMLCRFIQKHKLCDIAQKRKENLQPDNLQSVYELGKPQEFQNCRTQQTAEEKPGLRLRSNGSNNKFSEIFISSTPMPISCQSAKQYRKYPSQAETPKTIPEIVLHGCGEDKRGIIQKVKANLLDRFSKEDRKSSSTLSVSPIMFSPEVSSLQMDNSAFESGDEIDTKTAQEKQF